MRIRRMLVTTAAVAAAVTGVVVVQSGIPGTGALPIVRHADSPAAPEGPGLPAPGETVLAPPSAGVVQDVSATATVVRAGTRPAATEHRSGKDRRPRSGERSKADSGSTAEEKAAKDKPSKDEAGKGDSGGKDKPATRKSKDG